MKFKFIFLIILLSSCNGTLKKNTIDYNYSSSGFAYIYNFNDFEKKIIKKKYDNSLVIASHNKLKPGTLVEIMNPKNKKSLILKIKHKTDFPDFDKILLTEASAMKLNLDIEFPYVEILQIKKNKSFVAKKAETFNEEKKIHSKAPVQKVKIDSLYSTNKRKTKKMTVKKFKIIIAEFYSLESALVLKNNLTKNLSNFDDKKLSINKKSNKSNILSSGPYSSINLLKNDYIKLKSFGLEQLDIKIYE